MDKKLILESLIAEYADGNKKRFAELLGVTPQTISTWLKRETMDYDLIYAKCENISAEFILGGTGEPRKAETINIGDGNGNTFGGTKNKIVGNNGQVSITTGISIDDRDKRIKELTDQVEEYKAIAAHWRKLAEK